MLPALTLLLWLAGSDQSTPAEDLPSPALLEFLGSFEDVDGEWIDPMTLDDPIRQMIENDEHEDDPSEDRGLAPDPDAAADAESDRRHRG